MRMRPGQTIARSGTTNRLWYVVLFVSLGFSLAGEARAQGPGIVLHVGRTSSALSPPTGSPGVPYAEVSGILAGVGVSPVTSFGKWQEMWAGSAGWA